MSLFRSILIIPLVAFCLNAQSGNQPQPIFNKTLFVYDSVDAATKVYINAIKAGMQKAGAPFDEIAVWKKENKDPAEYQTIFLYSRVMAFTMVSPIKDWLKSVASLDNKNVYVFVTANRWFVKKGKEQIVGAVKKKGGVVVDAVSQATKGLTEAQKTEIASIFAAKIK
jgi:hypothetical protein